MTQPRRSGEGKEGDGFATLEPQVVQGDRQTSLTVAGSAGGAGASAPAGRPGSGHSGPHRTTCETKHLHELGQPQGKLGARLHGQSLLELGATPGLSSTFPPNTGSLS